MIDQVQQRILERRQRAQRQAFRDTMKHRCACKHRAQLARNQVAQRNQVMTDIVTLIGQAVGRGIDIAQLAQMAAKANEPRKVLFVDFTPNDTQPQPPISNITGLPIPQHILDARAAVMPLQKVAGL